MAAYFSSIPAEQTELIRLAVLFFAATPAPTSADLSAGEGPIDLSPQGGLPLPIVNPNRAAVLNDVGRGNETERHSWLVSPITMLT